MPQIMSWDLKSAIHAIEAQKSAANIFEMHKICHKNYEWTLPFLLLTWPATNDDDDDGSFSWSHLVYSS